MVLILSCVLFLWACLGDSTSSVKSVHPVHQALGTVQTTESFFEMDLGKFYMFDFINYQF